MAIDQQIEELIEAIKLELVRLHAAAQPSIDYVYEELHQLRVAAQPTLDALAPYVRPILEPFLPLLRALRAGGAKYVQGGRELWGDFMALERGSVELTTSMMLLIAVLVGLLTFLVYSQYEGTSPRHPTRNHALGAASEPVAREDAPPLPPPTEIVALRVYPIKSCRGFALDQTRLRKAGLALDRNWMFVAADTKAFLTIRTDPRMTLIDTRLVAGSKQAADPALQQDQLEIRVHGDDTHAPVVIPAHPTPAWLEKHTTLSEVEIWEEKYDGWIYSEEINAPFSAFLGKPVQLVYKGPTVRPNHINGFHTMYGAEVPHHFADVSSLQIASEASLADLNARLGHADDSSSALTIERFRPNIVVRGTVPWEEDTWKRLRITTTMPAVEALYKIDLDIVARCARCQVPNVDPDTAEKDKKEPWDTLMRFRRVDQGGAAKYKPCFGMMGIPKNEGIVEVGAKVEVLETTSRHLYNTRAFKDL